MTFETLNQPRTTKNLFARFDQAARSFMKSLRGMKLGELEDRFLNFDEEGRPFVEPSAHFTLRANGTFETGKFSMAAKARYPDQVHAKVYLFAKTEENMAALRAEWFETFAFYQSSDDLAKFGAENDGRPDRPFWVLTDEELADMVEMTDGANFFSPAIAGSEFAIMRAMTETKATRMNVQAREEIKFRETASAHERLARIGAQKARTEDPTSVEKEEFAEAIFDGEEAAIRNWWGDLEEAERERLTGAHTVGHDEDGQSFLRGIDEIMEAAYAAEVRS